MEPSIESYAFHYCKQGKSAIKFIIDDINAGDCHRVVVVGAHGFREMGQHPQELFPKLTLYYNKLCSMRRLLEICHALRVSSEKAVVVSNFPRRWSPPTIKWVDMPSGQGHEFIGEPHSLPIIDPSQTKLKLAIYFNGVHATSYYAAVIESQERPAGSIQVKVVSDHHDEAFLFDERDELERSDAAKQRELFKNASHGWEQRACDVYFTGGVLVG